MKPAQLLDMQADLLERLDRRFFVGGMEAALGLDPAQISASMIGIVKSAEAYRVTEDMSTLIQHAARGLDSSDTFDVDLPPTPTGIVRFERPLPLTEVRGHSMLAHWLTWGPAFMEITGPDGKSTQQRALLLTWWNDMLEPDEVTLEAIKDLTSEQLDDLRVGFGRWMFVGAQIQAHGAPVGTAETQIPEQMMAELLAENVDHPTTPTNLIRYAHAFWLMLDQQVTVTAEEPMRDVVRKRAVRRSGIPGRVTVIDLRRGPSSRGSGESLVEWSHRWVVRGHWRWQAVGKDRAERRRTWVNGHIKGPQGAPLIVSKKVYNVRP